MESKGYKKYIILSLLSLLYLISSNLVYSLTVFEYVNYRLIFNNEFLVTRTICFQASQNKSYIGQNIYLPLKVKNLVNSSVPVIVLNSGIILENLVIPSQKPNCVNISYLYFTPYYKVFHKAFSMEVVYTIYDCPVYSRWTSYRIWIESKATKNYEVSAIYPLPKEIRKLNGSVVLIYNLSSCVPLEFEVSYRAVEPFILGILFLFLIELVMIYVLVKTLANRYKFKEYLKILKPEEKAVIAKIYEFKNKLPQKVLYTEFRFSKAKVSRILKELEERQILERKTKGKEKIVSIRLLK